MAWHGIWRDGTWPCLERWQKGLFAWEELPGGYWTVLILGLISKGLSWIFSRGGKSSIHADNPKKANDNSALCILPDSHSTPPPHTVAGKQFPPARTPAGLDARRVFLLLAWSPVVPVIHQSSISPTFRPSSLSPQAKPAPLLPSQTPHPALRPTQPLRHPASQPHLDVSSHPTTTTLHNHPPSSPPPRPAPPTHPTNVPPSSPPPPPNPLDPPHPPPHHPPLLPLLAPPNNLPPPLQLPPPPPPSPLLLLPPPLLVLPARRRRPRPDPAAATTPARVARGPVPAASAVAACRCGGGRRWGRGRGGYRVGRVHEQRQGGGFCEEWEREGDYGVESGDECGVVGGGEGWFVSLSFPTRCDGG